VIPTLYEIRWSHTSGLSQIGSDQMHVTAENPLVPQCKFSALTNSPRHHGTLFDARRGCIDSFEISDLA
jgi:hypothetical protein